MRSWAERGQKWERGCEKGVCGWSGLVKGSKLQLENPCHLRGPVELIQAQFPRFAGVLGVRRRRHGDRTRAAPPPRRRGGLADGGRVSGGPALARTPPSRAPRTAPPRGPSPRSRRRRPSCRSAAPGAGLPGRGRPVPSRHSDSSWRRRRRRHGPGAGPCVTSARPRPPRRRGRHPEARAGGSAVDAGSPPPGPAPRGDRAPVPGLAPSPPRSPRGGLRSAGRGPVSLNPWEGTAGVGRGAASPRRLWGPACPLPPHGFSAVPARDPQAEAGKAAEESLPLPSSGPVNTAESRLAQDPLPTRGTCAALRLGSPYTLRPALPLEVWGRRLGTSRLNSRPELETRELRLDNQEPRPGAGEGGAREVRGDGGTTRKQGHTRTRTRWGPSRGPGVRVSWRGRGARQGPNVWSGKRA